MNKYLPDSLVPIFLIVLLAVVSIGLIRLLTSPRSKRKSTGPLPDFYAERLLNSAEQSLYHQLKQMAPPHTHLFAQVSYGEFLKCADFGKNNTMNQKRADFVICNGAFDVIAAIEYQGAGHYGNTFADSKKAKNRDNIKRMSLSEAGIPLIEIPGNYSAKELRSLIGPIFQPTMGIPPEPPMTSVPKPLNSD